MNQLHWRLRCSQATHAFGVALEDHVADAIIADAKVKP